MLRGLAWADSIGLPVVPAMGISQKHSTKYLERWDYKRRVWVEICAILAKTEKATVSNSLKP